MRKYALSLALTLLAAVPASTQAPVRDPDVVYGELMCTCGCNQVLGTCNHIGCPNAIPMRTEVDAHLAQGRSLDEVLDLFVDKYGVAVLSAPPTTGWFNISGWVMPFAALAAGLVAVAFYAKRFRRRWTPDGVRPAAAGTGAGRWAERLDDELKNFTPED